MKKEKRLKMWQKTVHDTAIKSKTMKKYIKTYNNVVELKKRKNVLNSWPVSGHKYKRCIMSVCYDILIVYFATQAEHNTIQIQIQNKN